MIRQIIKARGQSTVVPSGRDMELHALKERVMEITKLRQDHHQLFSVVAQVLLIHGGAESQPCLDLNNALSDLTHADVLELSKAGQATWESLSKSVSQTTFSNPYQYMSKIDKIETGLAQRVRERLESSRGGNELFWNFTQFSQLLYRPKIRAALQEHQAMLLSQITSDLQELGSLLRSPRGWSPYAYGSELGIPQFSQMGIHSRQMEARVELTVRRLEDVLGKNWGEVREAQRLHVEAQNILKQTSTKTLTDDWVNTTRKDLKFDPSTRVFVIRKLGPNLLELDLNYNSSFLSLWKDLRYLSSFTPRFPFSLKNMGDDSHSYYPYSTSLLESLRSVKMLEERLANDDQMMLPLLAEERQRVLNLIQKGFTVSWESASLSTYSTDLADAVEHLERKLSDLNELGHAVQGCQISLKDLSAATASPEDFKKIINSIQAKIDTLVHGGFSNLMSYVGSLNSQLELILVGHLNELVGCWIKDFEQGKKPKLGLAINIVDKRVAMNPSADEATQFWINAFHISIGKLSNLPRIGLPGQAPSSFRYLLENLPNELAQSAYSAILNLTQKLYEETTRWNESTLIWAVDLNLCAEIMSEDFDSWAASIADMRATKAQFSRISDRRQLGAALIDCGLIQARVDQKYEQLIKELVFMYGSRLEESINSFFQRLAAARNAIERQGDLSQAKFIRQDPNLLTGSDEATRVMTSEISEYINRLNNAKDLIVEWSGRIDQIQDAEKLLERNRFVFPENWIYADRVAGEWNAFRTLVGQQNAFFERHKAALQNIVRVIDRKLQGALELLHLTWKTSKPIGGEMAPAEAIKFLEDTENKIQILNQRTEQLDGTKAALGLPVQTSPTATGARIIEEEVSNLKAVWGELGGLHTTMNELKSTLWTAIAPKKIRETLENLLTRVRKVPVRYRQYEAFDHAQEEIKNYLSLNQLITELKSETLRERHWKKIVEILGIRQAIQDMTLGNVYESKPKKYEEAIREILTRAQGESGLSEFLSSVKEIWSDQEFVMIVYKNRTKLISGFDDIFIILDEHLNFLQSMKMSPYFSSFEEEATAWDDKLTRLRSILDVWLEVQRKWVYLEGVFSGSADIKALLPLEFNRFKSIDNDFIAIMKKAAARPKVIDVVNMEGLLRSLNRISDTLTNVQKALSDYLETQRSSFPRFYFVGDEDLLEIIGNARDPLVVQRHLSKMFAGMSSLIIDGTSVQEVQKIKGMMSKEGETVEFVCSIDIGVNTTLMGWLHELESSMIKSLQGCLEICMKEIFEKPPNRENVNSEEFLTWMKNYPTQIVILSIQIQGTKWIENNISQGSLSEFVRSCQDFLGLLSDFVVRPQSARILRIKIIQCITEIVHQRDVCLNLIKENCKSTRDFNWLQYMRFYYESNKDKSEALKIEMANAEFQYGYEYLGITERLVQTPLTDKCCLTLTQAMHLRLGGNPFGPAGTGKTETVKFLGANLGRFVLVFNCDESFDFHAMGRIFVGLCQVGAWGCFDEFNRLEERMLSAVSEQILTIQTSLREKRIKIELLGKSLSLSPDVGIFVTMNPGYAGRSNLPDNLKQLFREFAMIVPDKSLITEVMLYSHGFETAKLLANKVVCLFDLCHQQLTKQSHYDFGLRALKSVLSAAGQLKRKYQIESKNLEEIEQNIIIRSICDSVVPKLVQKDVPRLASILGTVFPGAKTVTVDESVLEAEIVKLCSQRNYEPEHSWRQKVLQLYQIQKLSHGVMLAGPTGVGKTSAWTILLEALEYFDGMKGVSYIIDPKALDKEQLYGKLDSTTLEWTDGILTSTIRKIVNSGTKSKYRHWIIFDGDVDPDWAENLNSVLDDNKLLTLPNGERFQIPPNVRLVFEVDSLKSATLATVSRCGMVWMAETVLSLKSVFSHHLAELGGENKSQEVVEELRRLASTSLQREGVDLHRSETLHRAAMETDNSRQLQRMRSSMAAGIVLSDANAEEVSMSTTLRISQAVRPNRISFMQTVNKDSETSIKIRTIATGTMRDSFMSGLIEKCLDVGEQYFHIMTYTKIRVVESLFSILERNITRLIDYQEEQTDVNQNFVLTPDHIENYIMRTLVVGVCWGVGGSMALKDRVCYSRDIVKIFGNRIEFPTDISDEWSLLDYMVSVVNCKWVKWRDDIGSMMSSVEENQVDDATLVIETADTRSHRELIGSYLREKRPFILCGPPGSGKTMTLLSTLRSCSSEYEICSLNFSSGTSPEMLLKTFNHYCEYVRTANGIVLRPLSAGKWLILFCDEINLPEPDKYGTQRVISFIRQLLESGTFWKMTSGGVWELVTVERIQFAGACNPPTDAGRHPMSDRFLRCAPILFVDFPGSDSLKKIYGSFNRAIFNSNKSIVEPLTNAMVEFYLASQKQFTVDMQPHYIYSPRELTRWKIAIHEALKSLEIQTDTIQVCRLAFHEAQRIFEDRLVDPEHKEWTKKTLVETFIKYFPQLTKDEFLSTPILYTCLLSGREYCEVDKISLAQHMMRKLRLFYEEEIAVKLVLFDQCLHHILRIDRVLRQPLGHLLLVGVSGAGKTILSKFVAWMNGLSVFQIKAGRNYDVLSFENDLRGVMKRAGIKEEKIVFIFDESNVLGPGFLERMNALLAAGEVPGLFEQDEMNQLLNECRTVFANEDESELFIRFTRQVQRNLHIIFTMNPSNPDFYNRQATSPALFNRCVIDWFGDWPQEALIRVATEFLSGYQLSPDSYLPEVCNEKCGSTEIRGVEPEGGSSDNSLYHSMLSRSLVECHSYVDELNDWLGRQGKRKNFIGPRDFLDLLRHLMTLMEDKRAEVADNSRHLTMGLTRLSETEGQVAELQTSLSKKELELKLKQKLSQEKMEAMIQQKGEAEEKKKQAELLARELDQQESRIKERKKEIEIELAEVQPLLKEAQESVSSIPKKFLEELRSMQSPPQTVKMVCEAVVILLTNQGERQPTWEEVRKSLRGDIIQRILQFDASDNLSISTVNKLKSRYLNNADWDTTKIDNASKAAGPLSKWVKSSCVYAEIILKVEPLRAQILNLEGELKTNQIELSNTMALINKLEGKLVGLQSEYAELITDEQKLKQEMESVNNKITKSILMLTNLTSEQDRWKTSINEISRSMKSELGDNILSSLFLTYIGFFEQSEREKLMNIWRSILSRNYLRFNVNLNFIEYLSKPNQRYKWMSNGLSNDETSMENTIILKNYIRYPLIIDPSGNALKFIENDYRDLNKVNSNDPNFVKQLESSIRFGTTLIIQDIENLDALLNNVLNQETYKSAGRILINIGESEIDFSPSFMLILITRDPDIQFTPDLTSRVTLINYIITAASLKNQCLYTILKSERNDVEQRRSDVLKLQGEFKIKIRELEDGLLNSLNESKQNILEDDNIFNHLEHLKKQGEQIELESKRTDQVFEEVNIVTNMYCPLADSATRLFTILDNLNHIYFMYHFNYSYLQTILQETLNQVPNTIKDYRTRLDLITHTFFLNFYHKTTMCILNEHKLLLAIEFMRIKFESITNLNMECIELQQLLAGTAAVVGTAQFASTGTTKHGVLNSSQLKNIKIIAAHIEPLRDLENIILKNENEWNFWIQESENPESNFPESLPQLGSDNSFRKTSHLCEPVVISLRQCLIIKALRPDRLNQALNSLVEIVMGKEFQDSIPELSTDYMNEIIIHTVVANQPIILATVPGFDLSTKVVQLSQSNNKNLISIAMGSEEGYKSAEKAIKERKDCWILLKNVHLCSQKWLVNLEKNMFKLSFSSNFRLFLTMEFKNILPTNLLRLSYKFIFEPPQGIKSSMERTIVNFLMSRHKENVTSNQFIRTRLYFYLAFLHSIIIERKNYSPIGWTKPYEFSDTDFLCSLEIIDEWIDEQSSLTDPERIPWNAIRTIIKDIIYGGRLDNIIDRRILNSLVDKYFNPQMMFNESANLAETSSIQNLSCPPIEKNIDMYLSWSKSNLLNQNYPPTWIGLAPHSNKLLQSQKVISMLNNLYILHNRASIHLKDFIPRLTLASTGLVEQIDHQKEKIKAEENHDDISLKIQTLIDNLPPIIDSIPQIEEEDPLIRFVEYEVKACQQLINLMKSNLQELFLVSSGNSKFTNVIRQIATDVLANQIPLTWIQSTFSGKQICPTLTEWIFDLNQRVLHLQQISREFTRQTRNPSSISAKIELESLGFKLEQLNIRCLWPGGLSAPEAFLSATKQKVAQLHQWPVDDLYLSLEIGLSNDSPVDDQSFILIGIYVTGAQWDSQKQVRQIVVDQSYHPSASRTCGYRLFETPARTTQMDARKTTQTQPNFATHLPD